jgi:hypothetical protein
MYGSIGKLGILGMEAATNQAICAIEPESGLVSRDWLYWFFRSQRSKLLAAGFGGTQANISQTFLKTIPVPVPPLDEQAKIVEWIEAHIAVVDAGFTEIGEVEKRLTPYGRAALATALSALPKRPLGEVVTIRAGCGFPKELQGRQTGELAFAKVRDISDHWHAGSMYLRTTKNYISRAEGRSLTKHTFPAGTVVMAKIGEAVRLNRRAILDIEGLVDNNVMGWIPSSEIDPEFLYFVSRTLRLAEISQATTVPAVRTSDVAALEIPVPSIEDQRAIVVQLTDSFRISDTVGREVDRARQRCLALRSAVLRTAFAGATPGQSENSAGQRSGDAQ